MTEETTATISAFKKNSVFRTNEDHMRIKQTLSKFAFFQNSYDDITAEALERGEASAPFETFLSNCARYLQFEQFNPGDC